MTHGYPWRPQNAEYSELPVQPQYMNSSSYMPSFQERTVVYPQIRGNQPNYLNIPGQMQANPSGRYPVVVVSQPPQMNKPSHSEIEPNRMDYSRNYFNNESHIIPGSHPEVGLELSRDLRSEHFILNNLATAHQIGINQGGSRVLTPSENNMEKYHLISGVNSSTMGPDRLLPPPQRFVDASIINDESFMLQTHQLTLRNYRQKSDSSSLMSSKGIYLGDFELNLHHMIEDFRRLIKNSSHDFSKSVIIEEVCYIINLQINCENDQFMAIMSPRPYNRDNKQRMSDIDDVNYQNEPLQEEQFIDMLKQVSFSDSDFNYG